MTLSTATHSGFSLEECRAVVQRLWPYLDGVLSPRERDLIAQHVSACSKCQPHFVFARSFLNAVRLAHGAPRDFAPLEGRVLAALAAEGLHDPSDEMRGTAGRD